LRLRQVNVHPLKSGAIRTVSSASVHASGLADDRSWMVVDATGRLVSAREAPRLLTIVADTPETDPALVSGLRLRAPGMPDLEVAIPAGEATDVRLFSLHLRALLAGTDADQWLRDVLGRDDVRLVWCHEPSRRTLEPGFSRPGDHTAFADSFPVTIASLASLRRLDDWIVERSLELGEEPPAPLPVERFRANLVVDGDEPFGEDGWSRVVVGDVTFRVGKPVGRCVMATIDPVTLTSSKEPTRTLARYRLVDGSTLFAVHLVPEAPGRVSVGDEVGAE
jgi:uncharacterized protein